MKIYLDGMFYRSTGVGRVYENLLQLALEEGDFETILTAVPLAHKGHFLDRYSDRRIKPLFLPYAPMSIQDLTMKSWTLHRMRSIVELYFYPGHNAPVLAPTPYVLTVHDTTVFTPLVKLHAPKRWAFRRLLSQTIRRARRVVTVSQTARAEIERLFPTSARKIDVVYNWIGDRFFEIGRGVLPATGSERGIAGSYILYLGLRIHHKNLDGVLAAFELLASQFPDLRLVVAGRRSEEPDMVDSWKARSPFADRVVEVCDPSDEEVLHLLHRAQVFVFPSFAEGFGLPPVEAMAAGVPVVASDIPVLREVLGDAALFADPRNPAAIAAAVRELLEVPGRSAELRAAGATRADRFGRRQSGVSLLRLLRGPESSA